MKSVSRLADLISEFPGIGPRQARRVVQFILGKPASFRSELSRMISEIGKNVSLCRSCFRYDETNTEGQCPICADSGRDTTSLMVVERDVDIEAVEASGAYKGRYFVLNGLMPMARQKKNGKAPRIKELQNRISEGGVAEVIMALSTTPEGDYTARELISLLSALSSQLKLSMLGRGLSVGAEIEYAGSETLRNAPKNRA